MKLKTKPTKAQVAEHRKTVLKIIQQTLAAYDLSPDTTVTASDNDDGNLVIRVVGARPKLIYERCCS